MGTQRRMVTLADMEYENLLEHVPTCLSYIEEGLAQTKGSILVHW
jgi:hypothetical protein